jgi:Trk K+ transport system NAD-binding subunit
MLYRDTLVALIKDQYANEIAFKNGVNFIINYFTALKNDLKEILEIENSDVKLEFESDDKLVKFTVKDRFIYFEKKDDQIWIDVRTPSLKTVNESFGHYTLVVKDGEFVSKRNEKINDEYMSELLEFVFAKGLFLNEKY